MALLFTLRQDPLINEDDNEEVMFLGVTIDSKLTWETHIGLVSQKLAKIVFFLRTLRETVSLKHLRTAYFAMFHSIMTYAIFNWGHSCHSYKIFAMQRRCMRVLCRVGYRDDCRPHFQTLEVLTLPSVYILECLMHAKNNGEDYMISESIHNYSTRTNQHYRQPFLRLQRSRNGVNYWAVKFFNVLPAAIKCYPQKRFKATIKEFLVKKCIYSFEEFISCDFGDLL